MLDGDITDRYIADAILHAKGMNQKVVVFIDTGAFNTMVDMQYAKDFGALLPLHMHIAIGGRELKTQACILHKVVMGDLVMEQVFALACPFKDWLRGHILLGLNVMNNWDFTISRSDNKMRLIERIPEIAPNKTEPYRNYFKNGKYIALQEI
jgi:hypothetical protein